MNLPARFTERAFRFYEPFIKAALDAYPRAIKVDPTIHGRSVSTFAARFRDARTSLAKHGWPTTIDREKFDQFASTLAVSERDGHVLIGPLESFKEKVNLTSPDAYTIATGDDSFILTVVTDQEKQLLCVLATARMLSRPLRVVGFTPMDIAYYETHYDVTFEALPNNEHILQ